jgi:hypothetical protein
MCEFLRVTSAAALTLFFSTPGFAASDQPSHEPHALQAVADSLGANGDTAGKDGEDAKSIQSSADLALAGQLRDLIETNLQRYVLRQQDRASVEAFYHQTRFCAHLDRHWQATTTRPTGSRLPAQPGSRRPGS